MKILRMSVCIATFKTMIIIIYKIYKDVELTRIILTLKYRKKYNKTK